MSEAKAVQGSEAIRRRIVTLGGQQVLVRLAGAGPAVLMLHRAPRSSRDLTDLICLTSSSAMVLAPDLAGYGLSEPLPEGASIEGYAQQALGVLDVFGVERCIVFGDQVGARAATRLAVMAPARVEALILRGLDEPMTRATVPPPLTPSWDGAHLAAAWAFLRDEAMFAPWNERSLRTRRTSGMPDASTLQRRLVELVSAGRQGRGYEAGFLAAAEHDLSGDLQRLATTVYEPPVAATPGQIAETILSYARGVINVRPGPPPAHRAAAGRLTSQFIDAAGVQLHARVNLDPGTVPLVVLHDAASSTGTVEPLVERLVGHRSVVALDLPGSGESDNPIGPRARPGVADYARWVELAVEGLGLGRVDVYGMWGGGFVGCELALARPDLVRKLIMSNLFFHEGEELERFQRNYTPRIMPKWHGGHLLQCWHQMRDQGLFFPWFDRSSRGVIRREPFLATDMIHERVCSLLKAGPMYRSAYQAHFVYPTVARVAKLGGPTLLATSEWDPNRPHTEAVARRSANCQFMMLGADYANWGRDFLPFLEHGD